MSVSDEYKKILLENAEAEKEMVDKSTAAQMAQLAQNKALVEAEKQNAYRGAYVDYAKNINPYGVQSELAYGAGLGGAGKGETAQANYYNTYQNRLGEINTSATNQLRDIANQGTNLQLSADQQKLAIDSTAKQNYANAMREDAIRQEGYDREDKANAYNRLLTAITSAGYNPTDEELMAAGMSRNEANAYKTAYSRSLYSGSGSSPKSLTDSQISRLEEQLQFYSGKADMNSALSLLAENGISGSQAYYYLDKYFPDTITGDDGMTYKKQDDGSYKAIYQIRNGVKYLWNDKDGGYTTRVRKVGEDK